MVRQAVEKCSRSTTFLRVSVQWREDFQASRHNPQSFIFALEEHGERNGVGCVALKGWKENSRSVAVVVFFHCKTTIWVHPYTSSVSFHTIIYHVTLQYSFRRNGTQRRSAGGIQKAAAASAAEAIGGTTLQQQQFRRHSF
jgi:hypothetical protein